MERAVGTFWHTLRGAILKEYHLGAKPHKILISRKQTPKQKHQMLFLKHKYFNQQLSINIETGS